MPLTLEDARGVAKDLLQVRRSERDRLDVIKQYVCGKSKPVFSPQRTTREYQQIIAMSNVNVFPLIISTFAQNLFVEGYRPAKVDNNSKAWDLWQANRMDARQSLIYRPALTYGLSYATVLKSTDSGALITPYSPRDLTAVYEDVVNDEWPVYAIAVSSGYDKELRRQVQRVDLYDDQWRYRFLRDGKADGTLAYVEESGDTDEQPSGAHGLPVCPVVRFLNAGFDLDDGPRSEVEPLIPEQDQINNTTYALLIAQQFAAFRQRWVTGMTVEEDANGNPREPFNIGADRLMQGEDPDIKFGSFDATELGPYLESRQSTLRIISALAQMSPHQLLVSDGISNLSAEALAALESAQQRKVGEMKTSFGESCEQMLRLAAYAAGDEAGWNDTKSEVLWRDTEARSFGAAMDGLGKAATMLAVPPRGLWDRVPGVTQGELERWAAMADKMDGMPMAAGIATPPTPEQVMANGMGGANVLPAGAARSAGPARPPVKAAAASPN